MSYSVAYGFADKEPEDGPFLASGAGWYGWCEWVEDRDAPECHELAQNGFYEGDFAELVADLAALPSGGEDIDGITATLKAAVADRPDGCECVLVTDGTEPGEDEDDGEEGEDDDTDEE